MGRNFGEHGCRIGRNRESQSNVKNFFLSLSNVNVSEDRCAGPGSNANLDSTHVESSTVVSQSQRFIFFMFVDVWLGWNEMQESMAEESGEILSQRHIPALSHMWSGGLSGWNEMQ